MTIIFAAPIFGNRQSFWTITPMWVRMIFWLSNIQLTITGWGELPESIRDGHEPTVFMSNHTSNLDPLVLMSSIHIPAVYIAKKELKWMIPIGWAAMVAGTIFVDRNNIGGASRSVRHIAAEIRNGKSVVIFPEGTRTRTGQLLPFKKGGFIIAKEAKVRIVPVATLGGYQILPAGAAYIRPGYYTVKFGTPVDPSTFNSTTDLMTEIKSRILALQSTPTP
jgi:1-acyl-sn-glycerol-3-phosphate acyltransferase